MRRYLLILLLMHQKRGAYIDSAVRGRFDVEFYQFISIFLNAKHDRQYAPFFHFINFCIQYPGLLIIFNMLNINVCVNRNFPYIVSLSHYVMNLYARRVESNYLM